MTDATPETSNFGFTRVGSGESVSKNGYAAQDLDPLILDKLLYAAFNHTHNGVPPLGDPTYPAALVATATVGNLPASTTYYYRVSYMDAFGLETAASPEAAVTTPAPAAPPEAPGVTALATGGAVSPGIYSYLATFLDDQGGETTPSPIASVQVTAGSSNRIRIDLPDIPTITDPVTGEQVAVATAFNVYRSRPGQSDFYYLGTTSDGSFYDAGDPEDQTVTVPTKNTTNATNGVEVTIPGPPGSPFIPLGCVGWRIYRATASGGYDGNSLVHEVTEGNDNNSTTPALSYIDTGDALLQGFPKNNTSVPPSSPVLTDVTVNVPRGKQVFSSFASGTITNSTLIAATPAPHALIPVKLSATFKTPPSGSTVMVTFRFADHTGAHVDLNCNSTTHQSGDAANYWHYDYPLIINGYFEAEDGTASRDDMLFVDDILAGSGQAVQLDTDQDQITVDLGTLDVGSYATSIAVRVSEYDTSLSNDLVIEVYQPSTSTVLATTTFDLDDETLVAYQLLSGPSFNAPGGADIQVRVRKDTASGQVYLVDNVRSTAESVTLDAGTLSVTSLVTGGTTTAADANVAIWF